MIRNIFRDFLLAVKRKPHTHSSVRTWWRVLRHDAYASCPITLTCNAEIWTADRQSELRTSLWLWRNALSQSSAVVSSRITVETGLAHASQLISTQAVKGRLPGPTSSNLHENQSAAIETGPTVFLPCLRKPECSNICEYTCICQNNGSTLFFSYIKTLNAGPPRV